MNKGLFEKRCKYSIRKFSLGVASVMIELHSLGQVRFLQIACSLVPRRTYQLI